MRLMVMVLALVMAIVPTIASARGLALDKVASPLALQEGMSRYEDPDLGFSFQYPDSWELYSRTQSGDSVRVILRSPEAEFGMHSAIVLETEGFAGSLEDLLGVLKKRMAGEPNGLLETVEDPVLVADVEAQFYRAKFDLADGRTVYIGGEALVAKGRAYNFYIAGSLEAMRANDDLYPAILDSLMLP